VRKLPAIALAGAATVALAATALAASPKTHVMNVPLPDGSVARVEYVGDVAPKVTVAPGPVADIGRWAPMAFPSLGGFDQMMQQMQQQIRQVEQMARQPVGKAGVTPWIAGYGNLPQGATSTTVVSHSNGGSSCTRTTQVFSRGEGKPPKVVSNVSGDCGPAAAPASTPPAGPGNPA